MTGAKELLQSFVEQIQKIIIEFNYNEKNGAVLLTELKKAMGEKYGVQETEAELFETCVYNALATINTVPTQTIKSEQLFAALEEAKNEMEAIGELM